MAGADPSTEAGPATETGPASAGPAPSSTEFALTEPTVTEPTVTEPGLSETGPGRAEWTEPATAGALVASTVAGTEPVAKRFRFPRGWKGPVFTLAVYALSRALVLAVAALDTFFRPGETAFQVLRMWDGGWFLSAATTGYPHNVPQVGGRAVQSTLAFFPGYPFAIRVVRHIISSGPLRAGLLISLVCGTAVAVLLWYLAAAVADEQVANRAVVLFAFFPASFVLSLVYAEALMLLGCAVCLLAILKRNWWLAGSVAAVATAVRPNALALSLALLVAGFIEWHRGRSWRAALAPFGAAALSTVGFLSVMVFFWRRTGEAFAWFRVQRQAWGTKLDWGHQSWKWMSSFLQHPGIDLAKAVLGLSAILAIIFVVVLLSSRQPWPFVAFGTAVIAMPFMSANLTSPRFIVCALPVFPALAARLRGQLFTIVVATSAFLLALLMVAYGETIHGPLTLAP